MFSDELLAELLRIFNNSALDDVGGDVIGRIYEYFLNKFAKNIAQDDGVFFTPKSLVKMIVNILEPRAVSYTHLSTASWRSGSTPGTGRPALRRSAPPSPPSPPAASPPSPAWPP